MGCGSSHDYYPPEIFEPEDKDYHTAKTGNRNAKGRAQSHQASDGIDKEKEAMGQQNLLRGDVMQKQQAKRDRKQKLKDKQKKAASAAESLASQVMEERETLSLTSRSRGTSRATSRTASPTGTRKQVPYKPQISEVNSDGGDLVDSSNNHIQNGEPVRVHS